MNYFRLHIGDYLRDAAHLSPLEDGMYFRVMRIYYTREAGIPDADKYRLTGARLDDERAALDVVLREFFTLVDGLWVQARCEREIAAYREKAERNREVGRLGGRPAKKQNPQETQTVSTPNPDETLASSHKPRETHTPRATPVELAVAMRQAGIEAHGSHPSVIAMAEQGVDVETAVLACRKALEGKPKGERLPVTYVAKVLASWALAASETQVSGARSPPSRASPTAADRRATFVASITGRSADPSTDDPRTIDVNATEPATPRIAACRG